MSHMMYITPEVMFCLSNPKKHISNIKKQITVIVLPTREE